MVQPARRDVRKPGFPHARARGGYGQAALARRGVGKPGFPTPVPAGGMGGRTLPRLSTACVL